MTFSGRRLTSTVFDDGRLVLRLDQQTLERPGQDEVIVQVEAAPINPSDLGQLIGPADLSTMRSTDVEESRELTFSVPSERLPGISARLNIGLVAGNEGAGTVVAAGSGAEHLLNKRVAVFNGSMYADYRTVKLADLVELPDVIEPAQGAAIFVNPMTALGFVETARRENHKAIIHTAAASSLGQILQKICLKDNIPLVNVVRSADQEKLLRGLGAEIVINTADEDFRGKLAEAADQTGATIAFDALGGGTLGSDIMAAMEMAAKRHMTNFSPYGSDTFKQLYLYGRLDTGLTILNRPTFGSQWSISGWLLWPMLRRFGVETQRAMRRRILDELTSTFAIRYTRTISLSEALDPEILRAYEKKATGQKFLIDPSKG